MEIVTQPIMPGSKLAQFSVDSRWLATNGIDGLVQLREVSGIRKASLPLAAMEGRRIQITSQDSKPLIQPSSKNAKVRIAVMDLKPQLADLVIDLTGSRSELVRRPLPQDDPVQRQPDISLAKEKLGWQPAVPLKEGLRQTIAYFETVLKEMDADA